MSIIIDSSPVIIPGDSTKLIRYLDLAKLLSLIDTSSLFLSRMDKLDDKFEGRMLAFNAKLREKMFYAMKEDGLTPFETFLDFEKSIIDSHEIFRKRVFLNSWNIYDGESMAMWKIYSEMGNGIAIVSDVSRIKDALKKSTPDVYLSQIEYFNHESGENMKDGNIIYPIITKQIGYSYENEVRIFHISHDKEFIEENEYGIYLPVELERLLIKIIIGPFTPKWIEEAIVNLLEKYDISGQVIRSSILI